MRQGALAPSKSRARNGLGASWIGRLVFALVGGQNATCAHPALTVDGAAKTDRVEG